MQPSTLFTPDAPGLNSTLIAQAIHRYVGLGEATHRMRDYQTGSLRALGRQLTQTMYSPLIFNRPPEDPDHEINKMLDGGLICLPPGMGKTYVFGSLIKAVNPTPDTPIVVSTPYKNLNTQVMSELVKKLGIPESDIGIFDSDRNAFEKKRALKSCKVIVTSCASIGNVLTKLNKAGKFAPLIIPDEVDFWAIGPATSKIIKAQRPRSLIVGFTATEGGACKELFENQAPLYHKTYVDSIVNNHLCDGVRTHVTDITLDDEWAKRLVALEKTEKGEADISKTNQELFSQSDATLSAALYNHFTHVDPDMGQIYKHRTFFFVRGVKAADDGAKDFNLLARSLGLEDKVKAASITYETDKDVARQMLTDFKSGKITALFSDRILSRGVNVEDGAVVHNLRLSKKKSVVTQMLGRATRKQSDGFETDYGGNKVAVAFSYRLAGTNPVLFGELLEGKPEVFADVYHPTPPEKKKREEKLPIPQELTEKVHKTAKFYTKTEEVAELISSARAIRDGLGGKLQGQLNRFEYAEKLHMSVENPVFLEFWNALQRRYRDNPAGKIILDNQEIECGYYHVRKRGKEFCISEKHLELFAHHMDAALGHYKPMVYFIDALEGPGVEDAIRARWQILADEYAKPGDMPDILNEREVHIGGKTYRARLPVFGKLPDDLQLDVKAEPALRREIDSELEKNMPSAKAVDLLDDSGRLSKSEFARAMGRKPDDLYFNYMWKKLTAVVENSRDGRAVAFWEDGGAISCTMDDTKTPPEMMVKPQYMSEMRAAINKPGNDFVSLHEVIEKKTGFAAVYDREFADFYEEMFYHYPLRLTEAGQEELVYSAESTGSHKKRNEVKPLNADFIQELEIGKHRFLAYMYGGQFHIQKKYASLLPLNPLKMLREDQVAKQFKVSLSQVKDLFGDVQARYDKVQRNTPCVISGRDKPVEYDCALPIRIGGETIQAIWAHVDPNYKSGVYIDASDMGKLARILQKKNILSAERAAEYQTPPEVEGFAAKTEKRRGRPKKDISPGGIKNSGSNGREPGL